MKKFFTFVSMALVAMSVNAQVETLDVMSDEVQAVIANAIANPVDNSNPNFIEVPQSENVFPEGTYPDNWQQVTGGSPIIMKDYIWEAHTPSIDLKAVSTPNLDASANQSWEPAFAANDNMVLSKEGYATYTMAYKAKNGNPSLAYKDYWDLNGNGDAVHRVSDVIWTPDCGELPAKGLYYQFTAKTAGTMIFAIYIHRIADVGTYVVETSSKKPLPLSAIKLEGYMTNNTWDGFDGVIWHEFVMNENYQIEAGGQNRCVLAYMTFNVEAGKSYMVFNDKQQLGLYGFEFTPSGGADGITEIATTASDNAPVYNLAGQRVSNDTKGLLIKNGKKFINK